MGNLQNSRKWACYVKFLGSWKNRGKQNSTKIAFLCSYHNTGMFSTKMLEINYLTCLKIITTSEKWTSNQILLDFEWLMVTIRITFLLFILVLLQRLVCRRTDVCKILSNNYHYEKCPYSEFFWSVFSRIGTEYWEILRISRYSVRMRENTDQKKFRIRTLYTQYIRKHFL